MHCEGCKQEDALRGGGGGVHNFFSPISPCRVLELKHEMVKLELLEFHYFDDILTDMKLTPVSCDMLESKVYPHSLLSPMTFHRSAQFIFTQIYGHHKDFWLLPYLADLRLLLLEKFFWESDDSNPPSLLSI